MSTTTTPVEETRPVRTKAALPAWLLLLLLTSFAVGTDDFVIAGVLPEIADDLLVSEAVAGQLVTVFAVTYALAAPVMRWR